MRERNVQWRSSIRVRHGSTRVINGTLSDIITINITSHYFMMKYIDTPPYVKRKRKKNMTITLGHQKMWALYDITSRFIVPLRYFITFGCNLLLYEITSFRIMIETKLWKYCFMWARNIWFYFYTTTRKLHKKIFKLAEKGNLMQGYIKNQFVKLHFNIRNAGDQFIIECCVCFKNTLQ